MVVLLLWLKFLWFILRVVKPTVPLVMLVVVTTSDKSVVVPEAFERILLTIPSTSPTSPSLRIRLDMVAVLQSTHHVVSTSRTHASNTIPLVGEVPSTH